MFVKYNFVGEGNLFRLYIFVNRNINYLCKFEY